MAVVCASLDLWLMAVNKMEEPVSKVSNKSHWVQHVLHQHHLHVLQPILSVAVELVSVSAPITSLQQILAVKKSHWVQHVLHQQHLRVLQPILSVAVEELVSVSATITSLQQILAVKLWGLAQLAQRQLVVLHQRHVPLSMLSVLVA
ncbi:hypothetical protein DPMN_013103 [Dreissena polymorpha]|uniref:Uncharacterized protein n=1 Tax=Dreissena polymorpha TaxID=45954 RepID=A0A9D4N4R4_DREPO|nr:hypothetical protein DPMN_013103 [Dreissena polymorpha]